MRFAAHLVIALVLLPLIAALLGSFTVDPSAGPGAGAGYAWWWGTPRGWSILLRTFAFAGFAAMVGTIAGWVIATAAARAPDRLSMLIVIAACLPLLLPASLLGTAWIMALGRDGWATAALGWPWTIYHAPIAAAAVGLRYCGLAALVLLPECARQARPDAAERAFAIPHIRRWLHLRLRPAVRPLLAAVLLLTLLAANDHILPGMFLVTTYGTQVLIQHNALLDSAGAAALAIPPMLLAAALAIAALRFGRPFLSTDRPSLPMCHSPSIALLRALPVLCIAVGLPLAALAARAGSWAAVREGWAASHDERWHTLALAAIGGVLCSLLAAAPAAQWLAQRPTGRGLTSVPPPGALLLIVLIAPPSLLALGVIALTDRPPLRWARDSDLPLMLGYLSRFTPVAALLLAAAWSRISPSVLDAASAHGVSSWRTFRSLIVPLHGPALLAAAGLCALLIATELEVSLMLTPPGVTTLGVRLYSMIHTAPDAIVSAAALGVLATVLVPITILAAVATRWTRSTTCRN